ncbi:MAG: 8-amino-7-oxononanoate synthase [Pseudomonadota bacterium]|nr:8-amino-7-oxononanoate synthase [Pseudomonadota bacterium]
MFDLTRNIEKRKDAGLYRHRMTSNSPQGVRVVFDGREYLSFCSNDYLGLATHPELINAMGECVSGWGVGAGASHLLGGHSEPHEELEQALANFMGAERALLFSTGYMANLAVLSSLAGRDDVIHQDKLNHASLIDGALLSRASLKRYPHLDMNALARQLDVEKAGRHIVASDGVFSMDGDLAPLTEMLELGRQNEALCYIDDAHGFAVLGEQGRGLVDNIETRSKDYSDGYLLSMCTLGKAMGCFGAFVTGSEEMIEALIQQGRSYIYTTALPPAVAAAGYAALEVMMQEGWRREKLAARVDYFKAACRQRNISLMPSATPIQPIIIGDNDRALAVAEILKQQGLLVFAIRSPTVAAGSERLRITLSATHEEGDIDLLLDALATALAEGTAV